MEVGLPNKLENIQVLRFIAAFSVMMVHLPIFGFGGWGVDIFFVISGFIMFNRLACKFTPHPPTPFQNPHTTSYVSVQLGLTSYSEWSYG